jgi:ABC-2 type transport system permease protein
MIDLLLATSSLRIAPMPGPAPPQYQTVGPREIEFASRDPGGAIFLIVVALLLLALPLIPLAFSSRIRSIARNTFFESIRQPIVLVVLVAATILLILSNPLSAFTMEDDQRMMIDIGMATVFLCGALLAAFVATGVLTREIENKTALTVISKPVGRPLFVIGKFIGVAGALMLATLYMSFVFLLVELHSVLETVRDPIHLPVLAFGTGAAVIGLAASIWCNYFYGRVFSSTAICLTTPLVALAYFFSLMFNERFQPQPIGTDFKADIWLALFSLMIAILVLTAIAIAASARLGQVMTLCVTLGVLLLGLLSDWLVGRPIKALHDVWLARASAAGLTETVEVFNTFILNTGEVQRSPTPELHEIATVPLTSMAQGLERLEHGFLWVLYSIFPNFQVLWLSDALTQSHRIPMAHVALTGLYGLLCIGVALSLAVILFQRREVG